MKLFRGREAHGRLLAKAASWRTAATNDTFVMSFLVTGKVNLAGTIAAVEAAAKIMICEPHEPVWASIAWGRR